MSTFVLVHGAWHGGWCWEKVAVQLRKQGHKVETPDLPGHGSDDTPIAEVSLQAYTDRICEVLRAQDEQVFLIGHSMGGIVISMAAERCPEKVKLLVYLTAFLLQDGEFLLQLAGDDKEAQILPNLIMSEDESYATINEDAVREVFYADCPEEDVERARTLLCRQAAAPLATPVRITEENFGSIPRAYIECLNDKAISPALQKMMYTRIPCREVVSMQTSHSPFFAAPGELVENLLKLSKE